MEYEEPNASHKARNTSRVTNGSQFASLGQSQSIFITMRPPLANAGNNVSPRDCRRNTLYFVRYAKMIGGGG